MFKTCLYLTVGLVLMVGLAPITASKRAYFSGKYGIELDSLFAGQLNSCDGGGAGAPVVVEPTAGSFLQKKHIGNVKYEDITVTCGTGMSKGMYNWIKDSFDHKHTRKNGAIIAADYNYGIKNRLTFTNALITEIGFPALDAASKDAAKMTIKLSPEVTRKVAVTDGSSIKPTVQKKWLPANFRLKIDGLEEACARVNKIEAITLKQKAMSVPGGVETIEQEVPNLVISCPESSSKQLYDWFDDFVIKGQNGDEAEKGGTLVYLDNDLRTPLFTLTFKNLGIFKIIQDKLEAQADQVGRVKAEMYCEQIFFEYGPTIGQ